MNNNDYISEEGFNILVDGIEFIDRFTLYGKKSLKYHIKRLQNENKQLKEQLQNKQDIINGILDYIDSNKFVEEFKNVVNERNDLFFKWSLVVAPVEYKNGKATKNQYHHFKINYCPMCGEKLDKGE